MNKPKSITKRLLHNSSWLLGGKTAASLFSALQSVIVARMLGVDDYGLLVLIIAFVDCLNQFFDFRVWETATKYIGTFWTSGDKERTRSMVKLSYIVDISSGILAFAIAVLTAKLASVHLIQSEEALYFIWIYAFSLLIDTANSTSDAILRVFDRFKNIAFISSSSSFIKFVLVSIVLYSGMGIKGVLISYIAVSFLGFGIRQWAVHRTLKEKGIERWWGSNLHLIRDQWRGIAWFLGNTSITATLKMANDNFLGILVLGYFSGKEAAAYYKIAKSFVKVMTRIMDPLYEAIYPELVRVLNLNNLRDLKKILKYSTKTLMKFTIPLGIAILIFSEQIVRLVYGDEYIPASNALRIVTVAVLITQLTFWINPALLAFDKPGLRTVQGIISTTLYVVLLFILVPKFSYIGAAFAFLAYATVNALISIINLRNSINEKEKLLEINASPSANREV